jgi:hypothetical protein
MYNVSGEVLSEEAAGLFAQAFMKHTPVLQIIEEHELRNQQEREKFISQVRCVNEERSELKCGDCPASRVVVLFLYLRNLQLPFAYRTNGERGTNSPMKPQQPCLVPNRPRAKGHRLKIYLEER